MKKLVLATMVVCVAAVTHAATANWSFTGLNVYNASSTKVDGLTAYLFDADANSVSSIYTAWAGGMSYTDKALASKAVAAGVIGATSFSAFEQGSGNHNFYFVVVDGKDKIYFSQTVTKAAGSTSTSVTVGFGSQSAGSQSPVLTSGMPQQSRWNSGSVPEPTSGLLVMLGVGLMALRRRRA